MRKDSTQARQGAKQEAHKAQHNCTIKMQTQSFLKPWKMLICCQWSMVVFSCQIHRNVRPCFGATRCPYMVILCHTVYICVLYKLLILPSRTFQTEQPVAFWAAGCLGIFHIPSCLHSCLEVYIYRCAGLAWNSKYTAKDAVDIIRLASRACYSLPACSTDKIYIEMPGDSESGHGVTPFTRFTSWSRWSECSGKCEGVRTCSRTIAVPAKGSGLNCRSAAQDDGPDGPP